MQLGREKTQKWSFLEPIEYKKYKTQYFRHVQPIAYFIYKFLSFILYWKSKLL